LGPIEYDAARSTNTLGPENPALSDVSTAVDVAVQKQIEAARIAAQNKK